MTLSPTGLPGVDPKDYDRGWKAVGKIIVGALAILVEISCFGALVTIIGMALREFFAYFAVRTTASLLDLLFGLGRMFWHVLVGSVNGAIDGLAAGFYAGLAAGAIYLIAMLFIAPWLQPKNQRLVVALLVALAGGIGASLGSKGVLADHLVLAGLVGGIFGLLTSLILLPRRV